MTTPRTRPGRVESPAEEAVLEPRYHLILLDDDDHTYQYVVELLGHVLGYGPEKSFALACVVDNEGRAIVETASHEQVTNHQRRIHSYGADPRIPRCRGSMSAVVDRAP